MWCYTLGAVVISADCVGAIVVFTLFYISLALISCSVHYCWLTTKYNLVPEVVAEVKQWTARVLRCRVAQDLQRISFWFPFRSPESMRRRWAEVTVWQRGCNGDRFRELECRTIATKPTAAKAFDMRGHVEFAAADIDGAFTTDGGRTD